VSRIPNGDAGDNAILDSGGAAWDQNTMLGKDATALSKRQQRY